VLAIVAILGAVTRNQMKVLRDRQARAALVQQRQEQAKQTPEARQRQLLFDMLQPVALANCRLERFGEANDGGYLMCANLLGGVQAGYSYGINGYDQWGCDVSTRLDVTVHQYDCFNTTQPACPSGQTVFHAECVGDTAGTVDGRRFDTVSSQLAGNGDRSGRIVLKIDVEGAEWRSLLSAPDEVLARIDQLVVEFHWLKDDQGRWHQDDTHLLVVERLRQFFEVAHLHFNNASCTDDLAPFPTWAYEVLFVSKRLAVVDPGRKVEGPHPLDAPNIPELADCQPTPR
jgi:hypothetical protein